jgi:ribosomal protein S27AE
MDKKETEASAPTVAEENWWDFCPLCGSKLTNHKCRLVCPDSRCGYFQSCSEFDT